MSITKSIGLLIKLLIFGCMAAVIGYAVLVIQNPRVRAWATGNGGPTRFAFFNQLLAMPAQAIDKTNAVVAKNNDRVAVLDKIVAEDAGATQSGSPAPAAADSTSPTALSITVPGAGNASNSGPAASSDQTVSSGNDPIVAADSPAGMPPPSADFLNWVSAAKITSVIDSGTPRILVDNLPVAAGGVADDQLGITFDHLDTQQRLMVFRDNTGAGVSRTY